MIIPSGSTSTKEVIILSRDCIALMVPSGARIVLQKGTEVTITQALGDSYTVNVYGNLARIEGEDAEALGKPVKDPLEDLPEDTSLQDKVWVMLKTCFDPEIPVNVVDLGLIYSCEFEPSSASDLQHVKIQMTLTAPGCGMGPVIAAEVKRKVELLPEVESAEVEIVFDPPWNQDMMSEIAKLELGVF